MTVIMRSLGIGVEHDNAWTEKAIIDSFGSFVRPGFCLVIGISHSGQAVFGTCGTTRTDESYDGHRVLDAQVLAVKQCSKRVFALARAIESKKIIVEEFIGKLETI